MIPLKLFMLLLGCKPPGRHTEQHDIFFGIAAELKDLVPEIQQFWPEPEKIHIDAWREVNQVDGFQIKILSREHDEISHQAPRLFFINLGGYQENKFEEQHYNLLTVKVNRSAAYQEAKQTLVLQGKPFSRVLNRILMINTASMWMICMRSKKCLSPAQKEKYQIELLPAESFQDDIIHLGYFKLSSL